MMWVAVYTLSFADLIATMKPFVFWKALGGAFIATWLFYLEIGLIITVILLARFVFSRIFSKVSELADKVIVKIANFGF